MSSNYKTLKNTKEDFKTLANKCPSVRIQIDGKAFRVFSLIYSHPKDSKEDNWSVLKDTIDGGPILIDKQTLSIFAEKEIQWLTESGSSVNTEPTILAVELRDRTTEKLDSI